MAVRAASGAAIVPSIPRSSPSPKLSCGMRCPVRHDAPALGVDVTGGVGSAGKRSERHDLLRGVHYVELNILHGLFPANSRPAAQVEKATQKAVAAHSPSSPYRFGYCRKRPRQDCIARRSISKLVPISWCMLSTFVSTFSFTSFHVLAHSTIGRARKPFFSDPFLCLAQAARSAKSRSMSSKHLLLSHFLFTSMT